MLLLPAAVTRYLDAKGIKTLYGVKVSPNEPESYITLGIAKPDATCDHSCFHLATLPAVELEMAPSS